MTQPNEKHREAARAIYIGDCACSGGQSPYTCESHEAIATALATTEAEALAAHADTNMNRLVDSTVNSVYRCVQDMETEQTDGRKDPIWWFDNLKAKIIIRKALNSAYARGRANRQSEDLELAQSKVREFNAKFDAVITTDQEAADAWACWMRGARAVRNAILASSPGPSYEERVRAEIAEAVNALPLRSRFGIAWIQRDDVLTAVRNEK